MTRPKLLDIIFWTVFALTAVALIALSYQIRYLENYVVDRQGLIDKKVAELNQRKKDLATLDTITSDRERKLRATQEKLRMTQSMIAALMQQDENLNSSFSKKITRLTLANQTLTGKNAELVKLLKKQDDQAIISSQKDIQQVVRIAWLNENRQGLCKAVFASDARLRNPHGRADSQLRGFLKTMQELCNASEGAGGK